MSKYLSADASIVHENLFENAMVKLMDGNDGQLNAAEQTAVKALAVQSGSTCEEDGRPPSSYIERVGAKRHRLNSTGNQYIDSRFIFVTPCTVERLFSAARWANTCLRKDISPILPKLLLILKLNRKYWDLKMVSVAVKIQPNERYVSLYSDGFYENHDFLI